MTDFFRRTGFLPGTAFVVASDAPDAVIRQARILKARYGDLIQICDGVEDDIEILAAIAAVGGARIVQLSKGTYNILSPILLVNGLILRGEGFRPADGTVINPTGTDAIYTGGTPKIDVLLEDFAIYSIGGFTGINASNFQRGVIQRVQISEGGVGSKGILVRSVNPESATSVTIRDCVIRNVQYGIHFQWDGVSPSRPNNNKTINNYIRTNIAGGYGIWQEHGYKIDMIGDTITGFDVGIKIDVPSWHGNIIAPYLQTNMVGIEGTTDCGTIINPSDDGNTTFLNLTLGPREVFSDQKGFDFTRSYPRNLVDNPGFELGTVPWYATGGANIADETVIVYEGSHALRITSTGVGTTAGTFSLGAHKTFLEGKTITLRARVYVPSTNVSNFKAGFNWNTGDSLSAALPKDDAWHEVVVTANIPVGIPSLVTHFQQLPSTADPDYIIVDNVQVSIGTGIFGFDYARRNDIVDTVFNTNIFQYPDPGTDWTPQLTGAYLAENLVARKAWIPLPFLKQEDFIVGFNLVGDMVEVTAATLDAKLVRVNKADPLTTTDVAGGAIAQVNTDGNFDANATLTAPERVVTDKQYAIEITGTTGANDNITVMGAEVQVYRR